jgi:hypothetical protein
MLEYNPLPPFRCGSPEAADEKIIDKAIALTSSYFSEREKIIDGILKKEE